MVMKIRSYAYPAIGLLTGPIFLIITIALDQAGLGFEWISILVSPAVTFAIFLHLQRRKISAINTGFFVLLSVYSLCFVYNSISIAPGPEQLAYMHLLAEIGENGKEATWVTSDWNFPSPKCYSHFAAKRYDNTSLEVAVFCYRYSKTIWDPNLIVRLLYSKLLCGYSDSEMAYEDYKRNLEKRGYDVFEQDHSFTAVNDTVRILCRLNNDHITVIKVYRDEEHLVDLIGRATSSNSSG